MVGKGVSQRVNNLLGSLVLLLLLLLFFLLDLS